MANKRYSDLTPAQKAVGDDLLQRKRPLLDAQGVQVVETSAQIRQRVADELLYQDVKQMYLSEKTIIDSVTRNNEM